VRRPDSDEEAVNTAAMGAWGDAGAGLGARQRELVEGGAVVDRRCCGYRVVAAVKMKRKGR